MHLTLTITTICMIFLMQGSVSQKCKRENNIVSCFTYKRESFQGARTMRIGQVKAPQLDTRDFPDLELLEILKTTLKCTDIKTAEQTKVILNNIPCEHVETSTTNSNVTMSSIVQDVLSNGTDVNLIIIYGAISATFILFAGLGISLALWRKFKRNATHIQDRDSLVYFSISDIKLE
ncbi:uncharacterized protein LOC134245523 [Saccostrea cucullata]|uniref:uncharacterized protein LOC134245523 n=1 Tax=Saccostrea cuccullata TaxID=36930 RepID=UPI002ED08BC4